MTGTHFDPACVAAFWRVRPQLEAVLEKAAERRSAEAGYRTVARPTLATVK